MPRPQSSADPYRSVVPLLLAFVVLSATIAVLSFLTLGFFGFVIGFAFALAAFIGFQYLLWGWWLGPMIKRIEASRRDADDDQTSDDQTSDDQTSDDQTSADQTSADER